MKAIAIISNGWRERVAPASHHAPSPHAQEWGDEYTEFPFAAQQV